MENIYTSTAILQMFNIENYTMKGTEKFIQYMRQRGVELELVTRGVGRAKSTFKILSKIEEEVKKDRTKVQVMEFTKLGLLELTRKPIYGK